MSRVRRTLALVRASKPAVRSIVFSMRMKAAVAREVVARRHRTQAADLIRAALRVSRLFPNSRIAPAGVTSFFQTVVVTYSKDGCCPRCGASFQTNV